MEQLYVDIDFHTLQIIRMSRTIRRYLWETGKHAIAQDEMMELINRWYSLFPMPRTMDGFIRESTQVGLSVVCKLFMKDACKLTDTALEPPKGASQRFDPKTVAFMIELLCRTEAGRFKDNRQFGRGFISKLAKKMKSKLKDKKLEDRMKAAENEPAHDMCHSLHQVLAPGETVLSTINRSEDNDTDVDTDDDVSCVDDGVMDEETAAEAVLAVDDDAQRVTAPNDVDDDLENDMESQEEELQGDIAATARQMTADISKNGYNLLTQVNLWDKGSKQLKKDGIKKKRVGGKRRLERKLDLARAIGRAELAMSQSVHNWTLNEDEVEVQETLWTSMAKRTSKFA